MTTFILFTAATSGLVSNTHSQTRPPSLTRRALKRQPVSTMSPPNTKAVSAPPTALSPRTAW